MLWSDVDDGMDGKKRGSLPASLFVKGSVLCPHSSCTSIVTLQCGFTIPLYLDVRSLHSTVSIPLCGWRSKPRCSTKEEGEEKERAPLGPGSAEPSPPTSPHLPPTSSTPLTFSPPHHRATCSVSSRLELCLARCYSNRAATPARTSRLSKCRRAMGCKTKLASFPPLRSWSSSDASLMLVQSVSRLVHS